MMAVIIHGPHGLEEAGLTYQDAVRLLLRRPDGATAAMWLAALLDEDDPAPVTVHGIEIDEPAGVVDIHCLFLADGTTLGTFHAPLIARSEAEVRRELVIENVDGCRAVWSEGVMTDEPPAPGRRRPMDIWLTLDDWTDDGDAEE